MGVNDSDTERMIRDETPAPITRSDSLASLNALVMETLAKDPADRPVSALHLAHRLRQVQIEGNYVPIELPPLKMAKLGERTNAPNEYQGTAVPNPGGESATPNPIREPRMLDEQMTEVRAEDAAAIAVPEPDVPGKKARKDSTPVRPHHDPIGNVDPSSDKPMGEAKSPLSVKAMVALFALLALGAGLTFLVSNATDQGNDAVGESDSSTTTTRAVVPTPEMPEALRFVTENDVVVLRWEHSGGNEEISFHVQDSSGSRVATGLSEPEFEFPVAPDFGLCFAVAAEAAIEGIARPLSQWVEACR